MRILGPLVCATTSAVTLTLASASASCVTVSPSTRRIGDRATSAPAAASSFSTSITSPSATLYCLPPVLTIAYIGGGLPVVEAVDGRPRSGSPGSRGTAARARGNSAHQSAPQASLRHGPPRPQTGYKEGPLLNACGRGR